MKLTLKTLGCLLSGFWVIIYFTACRKENVTRPNEPPVANAGPDITITLPTNTVVLNGEGSSDLDNNIASYEWTKISGPSPVNTSIPTSNKKWQVLVANLVEGIYQFELKVTDAGGLFSKDTVQVTVTVQPPQPPSSAIFYFSGLKWEVSTSDNGVKLIVPGVPNRNASDVRGVATADQANCIGPWGICYLNDFQYVPKDGTQPGVIYYRLENASVVLYIKSQPFNSYYQLAEYAVLLEF